MTGVVNTKPHFCCHGLTSLCTLQDSVLGRYCGSLSLSCIMRSGESGPPTLQKTQKEAMKASKEEGRPERTKGSKNRNDKKNGTKCGEVSTVSKHSEIWGCWLKSTCVIICRQQNPRERKGQAGSIRKRQGSSRKETETQQAR